MTPRAVPARHKTDSASVQGVWSKCAFGRAPVESDSSCHARHWNTGQRLHQPRQPQAQRSILRRHTHTWRLRDTRLYTDMRSKLLVWPAVFCKLYCTPSR